jgi:hypothetical protein
MGDSLGWENPIGWRDPIGWADGGVKWKSPESCTPACSEMHTFEPGCIVPGARKEDDGDRGTGEVPPVLEADSRDDPDQQRDAGQAREELGMSCGVQGEVAGRTEGQGGSGGGTGASRTATGVNRDSIERVLGKPGPYSYYHAGDLSPLLDPYPGTIVDPDGNVWRSNGDGTYTRDATSTFHRDLLRESGIGIVADSRFNGFAGSISDFIDERTGPSPVHTAYRAAGDEYYASLHPSDLPHHAEEGTGQEGRTKESRRLMASQEDLDNWYSYHAPTATQVDVYTSIRAKAKELAELFNEYAPSCADSTAAHRKLREAVMAMNLAIACNPVVANGSR